MQRPELPSDAGQEAARTAELALDNAYKERRSRPRSKSASRSVEVWEYIRQAVEEKRVHDAVRREQCEIELPPAFRSE